MKKSVIAELAVGFYLAVTGPAAAQTLKTGYISKNLKYLPFFVAQKKWLSRQRYLSPRLHQAGQRSDGQDLTHGDFFRKVTRRGATDIDELTVGRIIKCEAGNDSYSEHLAPRRSFAKFRK
ncbi:MAG: hypothetical protein ACXWX7_19900 [Candidatus Binatia bacterium]